MSPPPEPGPAEPGRTGPPAAATRSVTRRYGDVLAVDGVTIDVPPGEVLGLLGPNGAGKSTIVQLLCGLRRPTSGSVEVLGMDPRAPAARRRLGITPQQTGLPATLRVREVVDFVGRHYDDPVPTGELLDRFDLADQAGRQAGGLSGGQRRRLAVALAFVGRPALALLDEPTTGLDVESRRSLWRTVREYRLAGGTVLLSSHDMAEVEALADRVAVIHQGRLRAEGSVAQVRAHVPTRRVRLTSALPPRLDGVQRVVSEGDRHELWVADADAVVRDLVLSGAPFRDLEVVTASLEEAFLALTATARPAPAPAGPAGGTT